MARVESGETDVIRSESDETSAGTGLAKVSRLMVSLYKEQFGRGPVKARSSWAGRDILVCTLEESLTPAERKMREMGEHQRLRDMRMLIRDASTNDYIEPVERITGRKVRSFVSGIDAELHVSVEVFLFYPAGDDGSSRAEADGGPP